MAMKDFFKTTKPSESSLDNLDLPSFDIDFDTPSKRKDRKPSTRILADVRRGFTKSILDAANIKNAIRRGMPEGYGHALDVKDEVVASAKDLYDKAAKEVKPSLKELAKATNKLVPESSKRTKSALNKIESFFKKEQDSYADVEGSEQDYAISSTMSEIFKFQMQDQVRRDEEQGNKDRVREGVDAIRTRQTLSILNNINLGISRLAQYQDRITVAYQKKSLELQYRSYYLLADTLKEMKVNNAFNRTAQDSLVKNTALPDFVKMQNHEIYKQILKNKFANTITDKLFGTNSTLFNKAKQKLGATVNDYTSQFVMALDAATMTADLMGVEKEMGEGGSLAQTAGGLAGGLATNLAFRKMRKLMERNPAVAKLGKQLGYTSKNYMAMLKELAMKHKEDDIKGDVKYGGAKSALSNFFLDLISGAGPDGKLTTDKLGDMTKPAQFTNAASKSITEVIPGFLSRIYRELQVMRTGDNNIGLTKYDYTKNAFAGAKQIKSSIISTVFNKPKEKEETHAVKLARRAREKITGVKEKPKNENTDLDGLLASLDPTGTKLSKEARQALKKFMILDKLNGNLGGLDRYSQAGTFTGAAAKHASSISSVFKEHGGIKGSADYVNKNYDFNDKFNKVGGSMVDSRSAIQDLVNTGHLDDLQALGIVDEDGETINMEVLVDHYLDPNSFAKKLSKEISGSGGAGNLKDFMKKPKKSRRGGRGKTMAAKIESPVFRTSVKVKKPKNLNRGEGVFQRQPSQTSFDFEPKVGETISETLLRIEKILITKDFGAGYGMGGDAASSIKDAAKVGASWLSVKGTNLLNKFKPAAKVIGATVRGTFNAATTAVKAGFSAMGATANTASDLLRGRFKNLYVEGEVKERLLASKLRAGKYFDAITGKVITTFNEIKNGVKDEMGETVLTADEVRKTYMRGLGAKLVNVGSKIINSKTVGAIVNFGIEASNITAQAAIGAKNLIKGGLARLRDLVDGPMDVYVTGDLINPVLTAKLMELGRYLDVRTGKTIKRPSDITGPVRDGENTVLTDQDINKGLVNNKGEVIRSLAGKIGHGLMSGVIRLGRALKNGVSSVYGAFTKILGGAGGIIAGVLSGVGDAFGLNKWGKKNTSILQKIYDLLDERIPKSQNLRQGSWQEDLKEGKFGQDNEKHTGQKTRGGAPGEAKPEHKNIIDAGLEKLKGIKDTVKEVFGFGEDAAVGGTVAGKSKGLLSKVGRGAKGLLNAGKGLLGMGGTAAAEGVVAGTTAAEVAAGAGVTAVSGGGLLATMGTIGGAVLGGVGTLLGAIFTGIGTILASPVILGTLAVAAVGYGAYKLYKHFNKEDKLVLYRLAQYGFTAEDEHAASKILEFEELMEKSVKFEDGKATLTGKGVDYDKAFELFGFKPDDDKARNAWGNWLQERFKPVFLTHQTALNNVAPGNTLASVPKLPQASDKLKYITQTVLDSNVYYHTTSPFPKQKSLAVGLSGVKKCYDALVEQYQEEVAKEDKDKTPEQKAAEKAGGLAGGAAAGATSDNNKEQTKKIDNSAWGKVKDFFKGIGNVFKGIGSAIAGSFIGKAVSNTYNFVGKTIVGADRALGGQVNALEAIRFKAYGLTEMDRGKVQTLRNLEEFLSNGVLIDASNAVQWVGDPAIIYDKMLGQFNIFKHGSEDKSVETFANWLTKRVLPVYTAYRGELYKYTGKLKQRDAELALKPDAMTSVGQAILGANVWNETYCPWFDYELNKDSSSTQGNLQFLKDQAKDAKLNEQKNSIKTNAAGAQSRMSNADQFKALGGSKPMYKSTDQPAPDGETKDLGKSAGSSSSSSTVSFGKLTTAGGEMRDGTGAARYLNARNANFNGLNPEFSKLFMGMVQEYGELTGKTVGVNSAYRSMEDQAALYKKDPATAARPGSSMHEYGLGIDVDSATLNEMDKMGLMRKYGLVRPVGQEPWHVEPIGIQLDRANLKNNPQGASSAIVAGIGKGGGGWGTNGNAGGHNRNDDMSREIMEASITPKDANSQSADTTPKATTALVTDKTGMVRKVNTLPTSSASSGASGGSSPLTGNSTDNNAPTSITPTTMANADSSGIPSTTAAGSNGVYSKLEDAQGSKGWMSVKNIIEGASKALGIKPDLPAAVAGVESSFDTLARAPSSSAGGLFQFIDTTWNQMVSKYGSKFGIPTNASKFDPKANALLGVQFTKDNVSQLSGVKKDISTTDAYLAHFLGVSDAKKFLSAAPDTIAAQLLPKAASANPSIFYNGNVPRTVSQVYALLQKKLNDKLTQSGLDPSYIDNKSFASNTPVSGNGDLKQTALFGNKPTTLNGAAYTAPLRSNVIPASYNTNNASPFKPTSIGGSSNSPVAFTSPTNAQSSGSIDGNQSELLKATNTTNTILTSQLSVQQQMLAIMQAMVGSKVPGVSGGGAATQSDSVRESASRNAAPTPSVPVPMNRTVIQV